MTSSSTLIGDRRRAALARSDAMRRHPTRRDVARPASPPPTAFYVIAVVVTVFTMLGLVMVLSATSISQFHKGNSPWRLFNRQLLWAVLGVIGLWFAMRVPTRRWRRLVNPALAASCGLMLLPFVPGIGDRVIQPLGAREQRIGRGRADALGDQLPAQVLAAADHLQPQRIG